MVRLVGEKIRLIVTPRERRVSRNVDCMSHGVPVRVTPRERRVSRNMQSHGSCQ